MDPVTLVYPAPMRLLHAAVGGAARVLRLGRDAQLDWELRLRHAPRLPLHLARLARHASYRRSRADWRLGRDDYPGIYDWNALSYRPPTRYPGPITFLWSAAEPFRGGWREVEAANEVDVQVLPCRHMTCLNEHLDDLAARLRACLA